MCVGTCAGETQLDVTQPALGLDDGEDIHLASLERGACGRRLVSCGRQQARLVEGEHVMALLETIGGGAHVGGNPILECFQPTARL